MPWRTAGAPQTVDRRSIIASDRTRVNDQIRISPVRLIDPDGNQVGVVDLDKAKDAAREHDLDLVEVAPDARPPVVRIMDWGKYRYEQQKRAKEAKKKATTIEIKEVKFRPKTDDHDLEFKIRNARRFLEKGNKVKITVRFRWRELRRPELGQNVLDRVYDECADLARVESRSNRVEGRQLHMMLEPDSSDG